MATRATNLCGMPTILDALSTTPVVQGLSKGLPPPATRRKKLSDIIPNKADWWRLYIDRQHQKEASALADPGKFYDNDKSPGFQKAMVDAYTKILDGDDMAAVFSKGPMKQTHYAELYGLVKSSVHVEGKPDKKANDRVTFGIQPAVLAKDVTEEMVDGRILLTQNAHHNTLLDDPEIPNTISYMANVPNPEGSGNVSVYASLSRKREVDRLGFGYIPEGDHQGDKKKRRNSPPLPELSELFTLYITILTEMVVIIFICCFHVCFWSMALGCP
jgi:hypothetical protein